MSEISAAYRPTVERFYRSTYVPYQDELRRSQAAWKVFSRGAGPEEEKAERARRAPALAARDAAYQTSLKQLRDAAPPSEKSAVMSVFMQFVVSGPICPGPDY